MGKRNYRSFFLWRRTRPYLVTLRNCSSSYDLSRNNEDNPAVLQYDTNLVRSSALLNKYTLRFDRKQAIRFDRRLYRGAVAGFAGAILRIMEPWRSLEHLRRAEIV